MGGLTIENNFFILKIEKRNKIIVFDFQKVGAGAQKSGGAAALPAPPPPRSLRPSRWIRQCGHKPLDTTTGASLKEGYDACSCLL